MTTWLTMTPVVDGQVVDEDDLNPIITNVESLRSSDRVAGAKLVATAGTLVTGVVGTEVNIAALSVAAVPHVLNEFYMFNLTAYALFSAAGNSFFFRVRQTTALSGTVIVSMPWVVVAGALDDMKSISLPWKATSTATSTFHVSIQRLSGAGNASVYGDGKSALWVSRQGDSTVWTVAP